MQKELTVTKTSKIHVTTTTEKPEMIYILLWTSHDKSPFLYFGEGNYIFVKKSCEFVNCYVTSDRQLLGHYKEFEVVAFNGPQLTDIIGLDDMPKDRSPHQKYVYVNIEAESVYPICSKIWNGFFNWTWTYKLDSDAIWGYFSIKNKSNYVIGPSAAMNWISEDKMEPIDEDIKLKLAAKEKAAAWFVSNCLTRSKREQFFNMFQHYLGEYNLKTDVYGQCGDFQCPKNIMYRCLDEVQSTYYFYLAFENAISEDYITEKILHALNHYTVPIVLGGSNYSRCVLILSLFTNIPKFIRTLIITIKLLGSYHRVRIWMLSNWAHDYWLKKSMKLLRTLNYITAFLDGESITRTI